MCNWSRDVTGDCKDGVAQEDRERLARALQYTAAEAPGELAAEAGNSTLGSLDQRWRVRQVAVLPWRRLSPRHAQRPCPQ